MKVIRLILVLLGTLVIVFGTGAAILLRDGLAPGMVVSEGWTALGRIVEHAWPWWLNGALMVALWWATPSDDAS